jgi:hypothetical protein
MPTEAEKTASKQKVSTLQEDIEKAADDDAKGEVLKTFFSNATPYEMMLLANSIQRNSGRDVAEDAAAKAREMGLGQTAGRRRGRKYRSTRRR